MAARDASPPGRTAPKRPAPIVTGPSEAFVRAKIKEGAKNIKYHLEETTVSDTPAYQLNIENLKTDAGRYFDAIILETDSKIRPQLNVRVYGYLRPRKLE